MHCPPEQPNWFLHRLWHLSGLQAGSCAVMGGLEQMGADEVCSCRSAVQEHVVASLHEPSAQPSFLHLFAHLPSLQTAVVMLGSGDGHTGEGSSTGLASSSSSSESASWSSFSRMRCLRVFETCAARFEGGGGTSQEHRCAPTQPEFKQPWLFGRVRPRARAGAGENQRRGGATH